MLSYTSIKKKPKETNKKQNRTMVKIQNLYVMSTSKIFLTQGCISLASISKKKKKLLSQQSIRCKFLTAIPKLSLTTPTQGNVHKVIFTST